MTNIMVIMPTLPGRKFDIERDCVIVVDRQTGHLVKDCSRNKTRNTSNPRMTGNTI